MSQEKRIMVVDDEREAIDQIQSSLTGTPYVLETFMYPEKALASAQTKRYDLIIADFLMPVMDGIELVQNIKKTTPEIRSIILSGFTNLPSVLKAMKEDVISHYMTKPWDDDVLKKTLKGLLENDALPEKRPGTNGNPFLSKEVPALSAQAHQEATVRMTNDEGDLEKLERKYSGITLGVWKTGQVF